MLSLLCLISCCHMELNACICINISPFFSPEYIYDLPLALFIYLQDGSMT